MEQQVQKSPVREIKFRSWHKELEDMGYSHAYEKHVKYPGMYEIMQYTGLCDKNGKEIYEGDIIKKSIGNMANNQYSVGFVVWYKTEWRTYSKIFNCCDTCNCTHPAPNKKSISDFELSEIIGNIYENHELL